jgi:transposase
MLHAGLDLSRKRLDACLLSDHAEVVEEFARASGHRRAAQPGAPGAAHGVPVRGVIESMTGSRFVHDTLEELGWDVLIADAQKVKGLAPLACKTDKIDARVLAVAPPEPASHFAWASHRGGNREMSAARHPRTQRGP